jgi:hypothetical protein
MRLLPSSEASQAARDKQKAEMSMKPAAKRAKTGTSRATPSKIVPPPSKMALPLSKTGPSRKIGVVKVVRPRVKTRSEGTSKIELALAKPDGVSNFFLIRCSSFVSRAPWRRPRHASCR